MYTKKQIDDIAHQWKTNSRWKNVKRSYTAEDVVKLQGSLGIEYTFARRGAEKLWKLLHETDYIRALGAITGNQAVQQVQAGLKAIYLSGWQVAADMNDALQTYPDQSLYPTMSVPNLLQRINNAFIRADQIQHMENSGEIDWVIPLIADAEAGFGGPLNAFELVKAMIQSGASGIHLEDQLSSLKKCGHMGGKVLVPAAEFVEKLNTARLAADIMGIPTILIGRTDALSASAIRGDLDPIDIPFLTGQRSHEGYHIVKGGLEYAIARARAFGDYCDVIWCETSKPDLEEAREFAQAIHEKFPGKFMAYNCSPSFNWERHLDHKQLETFQDKLGELGYKFQFVTLAGFHTLNSSMFELAKEYSTQGMLAYSKFQSNEFKLESKYGYKAIKHQRFVGAGYFDEVLMALTDRKSSTSALKGSTEEAQF